MNGHRFNGIIIIITTIIIIIIIKTVQGKGLSVISVISVTNKVKTVQEKTTMTSGPC